MVNLDKYEDQKKVAESSLEYQGIPERMETYRYLLLKACLLAPNLDDAIVTAKKAMAMVDPPYGTKGEKREKTTEEELKESPTT